MLNLLLKLKSLEGQIKRNPEQVPAHQIFDIIVILVAKMNKFRTNAIEIPEDMFDRIKRKDFSFILKVLPEISFSLKSIKQLLCRSGFDKVTDHQIRTVLTLVNTSIPNIKLMEM